MKIEGNVVYLDLEGGFWGIVANSGKKFVPINSLASDFQTEGLAVSAEMEPVHVLGTTMWGEHVKINTIEKKR